MNTDVYLSLGQAAKEVGKSKGTISKYLKSGKLSYVRKEGNQYKIDPVELYRVFPKNKQETVQNERMETPKNDLETIELRHKIELLRKDLEHEREKNQNLREERDTWRQQATALLTDQRPKKQGNGFLRWLTGKAS